MRLRTDMACPPSGLVDPLGGEAASTSSLIATDTPSFEIGIAPGVESLRTRDQRKNPAKAPRAGFLTGGSQAGGMSRASIDNLTR